MKNTELHKSSLLGMVIGLAFMAYAAWVQQWIWAVAGITMFLTWIAIFSYHEKNRLNLYFNVMVLAMAAVALYGAFTGNWILVLAALPSIYMIRLLKKQIFLLAEE